MGRPVSGQSASPLHPPPADRAFPAAAPSPELSFRSSGPLPPSWGAPRAEDPPTAGAGPCSDSSGRPSLLPAAGGAAGGGRGSSESQRALRGDGAVGPPGVCRVGPGGTAKGNGHPGSGKRGFPRRRAQMRSLGRVFGVRLGEPAAWGPRGRCLRTGGVESGGSLGSGVGSGPGRSRWPQLRGLICGRNPRAKPSVHHAERDAGRAWPGGAWAWRGRTWGRTNWPGAGDGRTVQLVLNHSCKFRTMFSKISDS